MRIPGPESEERGIAEAIARSVGLMTRLRTPIVTVITGEGGSGGALAIAVGDVVLALENAVYSVISPEGCASILWRTTDEAATAALAMQMSAQDQHALGVIDDVIAEPPEGAHTDPAETGRRLKAVIVRELDRLTAIPLDTLVEQRYRRYRALGRMARSSRRHPSRPCRPGRASRTVCAGCSKPASARSPRPCPWGAARNHPPARTSSRCPNRSRPSERTAAERQADHAGLARLSETLVPALVQKLNGSALGELEVREGDWKIRLRRPPARPPRTRPRASAPGPVRHVTPPARRRPTRRRRAEPRDPRPRDRHVARRRRRSAPSPPSAAEVRAGDRIAVVDLLGHRPGRRRADRRAPRGGPRRGRARPWSTARRSRSSRSRSSPTTPHDAADGAGDGGALT